MKDVIIIGAGIAGLSAGFELYKKNIDFHILEAQDRIGGIIESIRAGDILIENGPHAFSSVNKEIVDLVRDLDIEELLIGALPNSRKRYIYSLGQLIPVPTNFFEFFKTKLLSKEAKFTFFEELFIKKEEKEETVEEFFNRRFGTEVLKNLIQPFLNGVYAGDIKRLSVNAVFPKLKEYERKFNSVLLGFLFSGSFKGSLKNMTLYSFKDGMETLPREIYEKIKNKVTLGVKGVEISRAKDFFIVTFKVNNKVINYTANSILFALPAYKIADFYYLFPDGYVNDFINIEYVPLYTVSQLALKSKVNFKLDGFGFLCIKEPHRKLLGSIWTSSVFPDRAPDGKVLLTTFIGGSNYKKVLELSEEEIAGISAKELCEILEIRDQSSIETVHIKRYENAIPQYNVGHLEKVMHIEELMDKNSGLFFTGNYLYGISINDTVKMSKVVVEKIKRYLNWQCSKEAFKENLNKKGEKTKVVN